MYKVRRKLDAKKLESSINRVKGVVASRVVLDERSVVSEIHVMASVGRSPKQIVRDIESLLLVNFGLRIDYRRVSLVQMEEQQILPLSLSRVKLASVSCDEGPSGVTARVEIQGPEELCVGQATGDETKDKVAAVAKATLAALQKIVGKKTELALGELREFEITNRRILVVLVSSLFPAGEESLLGISFVSQDGELEAAARATLDAVNRRLAVLRLS